MPRDYRCYPSAKGPVHPHYQSRAECAPIRPFLVRPAGECCSPPVHRSYLAPSTAQAETLKKIVAPADARAAYVYRAIGRCHRERGAARRQSPLVVAPIYTHARARSNYHANPLGTILDCCIATSPEPRHVTSKPRHHNHAPKRLCPYSRQKGPYTASDTPSLALPFATLETPLVDDYPNCLHKRQLSAGTPPAGTDTSPS